MAEVMRSDRNSGRLILDTGGLLAWAAGTLRAREAILRAAQEKIPVIVPLVVVAQAIRGGRRDAPVNRVLRLADQFSPITMPLARQAGASLGASATTDVIDALVAAEALQIVPATILTSDPGDMRRLLMNDRAHGRVQILAV